ncbi:MAG: AMP-binding protein, partial [Lachnospiraceae bacterium]|nr:AMP-binding protein [Lachnospiraceae bacterium]
MNVRVRSLVGSEKINDFCRSKGIEAKAMLATAFALAFKSYTAAEEATFACRFQGKRYGIRLECDGKETILSEIKRCESFFKESLENDEGSREDNPFGAVCLDLDGSCTGAFEGDLLLRVIKDGEGITWECEYNPASYSEYIVKGLIRTLDNVTGEFLIKDRLGEVLLTTKEDEEEILNLYDASSPFEDKPGYRHLQDSALKYPDRIALIAIDRTLTYKELNEEANALGHVLRSHGADIESKIAVMADRNSYGYVMREGALKSGGAFMPIDPEYPMERITYIREDSDFKLLVTTKEIMDRRPDLMEYLKAAGITVIDVTEAVKKGSRENVNIDVPGGALAYVIYTSGSTG